MLSAAGGVFDRSVGHSAYYPPFRSLLPQITFRIPHFRKLPTPPLLVQSIKFQCIIICVQMTQRTKLRPSHSAITIRSYNWLKTLHNAKNTRTRYVYIKRHFFYDATNYR